MKNYVRQGFLKPGFFKAFGIIALSAIFIFAGCNHNGDDDPGPEPDPVYVIGDTGPGGGKVFYVSAAGFTSNGAPCHYLEAAPADQGTSLAWRDAAAQNISTGTDIGDGAANTAAILAVDANAPAAKACDSYSNNGKTDWFLPSKDELNEMYQHQTDIGGSWDVWYWSSSQFNTANAWQHKFSNGDQNFGGKNGAGANCFRAVRAF